MIMFAWLGSLLLKFGGPLIAEKLFGLAQKRLDTVVEEKRIAADAAIRQIEAEAALAREVEQRRRLEAGHWTGRVILLLIMVPPAAYLAGIYFVSLVPAWGWTIQRLPAWLEPMLTALVPAWIGVRGFETVARVWKR